MAINETVVQKLKEKRESQSLGPSLYRASDKSPDQQAEIVDLSKKLSLPSETVERNIHESRRERIRRSIDVNELKEKNPVLARFLSEPDNAAVAVDDIENLRSYEDMIRSNPSPSMFKQMVKNAGLQTNVAIGNILTWTAGMLESTELSDDQRKALTESYRKHHLDPEAMIPEGLTETDHQINQYINELREAGRGMIHRAEAYYEYQPHYDIQRVFDEPTTKNVVGFIAETGFGSLPYMIEAMASPTLLAISIGESIAQDRASRNEREGDVTKKDRAIGIAAGAFSAALERIGALAVFRHGNVTNTKEFLKEIGRATASEGFTEAIQEPLETLAGGVGTNRGVTAEEVGMAAVGGLLAGVGVGGGVRTATGATELIANRGLREIEKVDRSVKEQATLEEIIRLSQNSVLRERAPDALKDYVDQLDPERRVYVSPQAVQNITEGIEGPVEPVEIPASLQQQLDQALETGQDIEMTVGEFARDVAGNEELVNALRPHLRYSADSYSMTELEKPLRDHMEKLVRDADNQQEIRTEVDAIYEQVRDELVETGRVSNEAAKYQASLVSTYAATAAERFRKRGIEMTPKQVFDRMKLRIAGPVAETTSPDFALTQSFTTALKLPDGTVVPARGTEMMHAQIAQRLVEEGKPLTGAQSGFIDEEGNYYNRMEAMQALGNREVRRQGPKVFAAERQDVAAQDEDIVGPIAAVLGQGLIDFHGEGYTQTEAFRDWFGDSKVVDKNGEPLVVRLTNAVRSVLSGKAAIPESSMDGLRGNAELISNLLQSETFLTKGLGGFDTPTQRVVLASVSSFGYDPQVLRAVIDLVPVDVMNVLSGQEMSTERLFSDEAMLKKLLSVDSDGSISTAVNIANALIGAVTSVTTKDAGAVGFLRGTLENGAATGADFGYLAVPAHNQNVLEFKPAGNRGTFDPTDPSILNQGAAPDYEPGSIEDQAAQRGVPVEKELTANLSAATGTIPGLKSLQEAANAGDRKAARLLVDVARDAIDFLTGGVESADITYTPAQGLYFGDLEPSLGLEVRFAEDDAEPVLAALAKFAENFNQEEIHVRASPETDGIGDTYPDGSYNTPVHRYYLDKSLKREEIEGIVTESGLPGFTVTDQYLEVYYVGDPRNEQEINDFEESARKARQSLEGRVRSIDRRIERIWRYGSGEGTLPYSRIYGHLRTGPTTQSFTARRIAGRLAGRDIKVSKPAPEITPEQRDLQRQIANIYEGRPTNDLKNPRVRRAYRELVREVSDQFQALPIKVEMTTDPAVYENSEAMRRDVLENNHLYVFATSPESFGPPGANFDKNNHPLLSDTQFTDINGKPMLANDLLRAVHDYYAHTMTEAEFGPKGEEAAWRNHMSMTRSPWARWALTTETRGQNSWVNFYRDEEVDHEKLPITERPFAEQKAMLLPVEYMLTGDPNIDQGTSELRVNLDDNGFYSTVEKAIYDMEKDFPQWRKGKPAKSQQIIAKLKKTGAKKEELEWTGIMDLLGSHDTFTQEQLLEFVNDNRVSLETVYADKDPDDVPESFQGFDWNEQPIHFDEVESDEYVEDMTEENINHNDYAEDYLEENISDVLSYYDLDVDLMALAIRGETDKYKEEDLTDNEKEVVAFYRKALDRQREINEEVGSTISVETRMKNIESEVEDDLVRDQLPYFDVHEDFKTEIHDYAYERTYNELVDNYNDNPVTRYTDDHYGIEIVGNNDTGYSINGEHHEIYSLNEAELRAEQELREAGQLDDEADENVEVRRHEGHAFRGDYENYREVKITMPEIVESFTEDAHFPDRNIIAFMMVTDRNLVGRPLTDEELQDTKISEDTRLVDIGIMRDGTYGDLLIDLAQAEVAWEEAYKKTRDALNEAVQERTLDETRDFDIGQSLVDSPESWPTMMRDYFPAMEDMVADALPLRREREKLYRAKEQAENRYAQRESIAERYGVAGFHYFIEALQSDWHQEGRQNGYKKDAKSKELLFFEHNQKEVELTDAINDWLSETYGAEGVMSPVNVGGIEVARGAAMSHIRRIARAPEEEMKDFRDFLKEQGEQDEKAKSKFDILNDLRSDKKALEKITQLSKEYEHLKHQFEMADKGVPNAPFKDDAWIALGLKRALIDAAKAGDQYLSWTDSWTQEEVWSSNYRELYQQTYNKKMPSIIKKMTGIQPIHLTFDGEIHPDETETLTDAEAERLRGKRKSLVSDGIARIVQFAQINGLEQAEVKYVLARVSSGDPDYVESNSISEVPGYKEFVETVVPMNKEIQEISRKLDRRSEPGYWTIPITEELKASVRTGMPLFQGEATRGQFIDTQEERIIKLGKQSNPSTFLHEAGHLFLEMEKDFAYEFGTTEDQVALAQWLGYDSISQIDPNTDKGREAHEKFARGFEAYLREGRAPSLKLRDAFAAFARWLKRIYASLKMLNVELNEEIRGVMDRMLATDEEITVARNNPAYDQFFQSREAAGMSPQEWQRYQELQQRSRDASEQNLNEKLIKELYRRQSEKWKEEKAPLIEKAKEELSQEPVYQVMSDMRVTPVNYDEVKSILGVEKLPGRFIGMAKKDGVSVEEYAEVYGYKSARDMLQQIIQVPTLKQAAEEQAQNQMVEKYGDILNDGSIEQEARESVHNEEQAKLLLLEVRAMNRKTRRPPVNREYLKAQARDMIGSLKWGDIRPDKYYKAEIRAAENAATATTDEDKAMYKTQQLVNHYLYKEATAARENIEKYRKYIQAVKTRDYSARDVDPRFIQNMKVLAKMYDMRKSAKRTRVLDQFLSWYETQINDENQFIEIQLLDPNLVMALEAKKEGRLAQYDMPTYKDLTVEELRGLYDMVKHLRYVGGQMADVEKAEHKANIEKGKNSIIDNGGKDVKTQDAPGRGDDWFRMFREFGWANINIRNMTRKMDGGAERGWAFDNIQELVNESDSAFMQKQMEVGDKFREELEGLDNVTFNKGSKITKRKENGGEWTLHSEARIMLALYWGTESSREAIMAGHQVTEGDVLSMLSEMTEDELQLVNRIWRLNESLWPQMSALATRIYGVSPAKLDATPFEVNGVKMTGGHMRLYYGEHVRELEGYEEQMQANAPLAFSKPGTLNERVGSGGKKVMLSKTNIIRSLGDNVHALAYAENYKKIARRLRNRDIRDAIIQKHGEPFYNGLTDALTTAMSPKRDNPHTKAQRLLESVSRLVRSSATYGALGWSIRNTMQQTSALAIAQQEVGTADLAANYVKFLSNPMEFIDQIKRASPFMDNRGAVVNREASEQLNKISEGGVIYQFKQAAFVMQTTMDGVIAYPTWMARYNQTMEAETAGYDVTDEVLEKAHKRAVQDADQAVKETVGAGLDSHLGSLYSSKRTEFIRMITMFMTFFNTYLNRIYRDYQRGQGNKIVNAALMRTLFITPVLVGTWEALVTHDTPDDDEEWWEWAAAKYGSFMIAMLPGIRETVSAARGFAPTTPTGTIAQAAVRIPNEWKAYADGRQSLLKTVSDTGRAVSGIVPFPGAGQAARMVDYWESYEQGKEGEFDFYQMMTEGPTRE